MLNLGFQKSRTCIFVVVLMLSLLKSGAEEKMYGYEILLDKHTVLLTEGTRSELEADDGRAWPQRFPMIHIEQSDTCEIFGWTRRVEPRRIFDAFTFFNEIEVLNLRVAILRQVVDRFVVAEATRTHSNQPKSLMLDDWLQDMDDDIRSKFVRVVVEDMPDSSDAWVLEHYQRDALLRGLAEAGEHDLVFISDVDEIPAPHVVNLLKWCEGWDEEGPVQLYTRFYNFKFSWQFEAMWHHPQAIVMAQFSKARLTPQSVRMARTRPSHLRVEDAGWHTSFFANSSGIVAKMKAYAHQVQPQLLACFW